MTENTERKIAGIPVNNINRKSFMAGVQAAADMLRSQGRTDEADAAEVEALEALKTEEDEEVATI